MIARVKSGWTLTKKSWFTLKNDKSLALFPIISAIASLAALIVLALPLGGGAYFLFGDAMFENPVLLYLGVFLFLVLTTIITVFFNIALTAQAAKSFRGEDTNIKDGISLAWQRKGVIVKWALLAAFVGTLLRILEERLSFIGALLSALGGLAWAVASWFVIPILAFENVGPIDALKRSGVAVKKRWGEGVIGVASISGIFLLAGVILIALLIAGIVVLYPLGSWAVALWVFAMIFLLVLVSIIATAMRQIFNVAVYLSIESNMEEIGIFSKEDLAGAARVKDQG